MTDKPDSTADRSEVTSIIRHDVRVDEHGGYEEWLREIVPTAARFPGHRGVNIIRPVKGATEYTIVLHFDTIDNLRAWLGSDERRRLMEKAFPKLLTEDRVEIKTGLEFWFTPISKQRVAPPYKQFLVTLSVIYPLTIIIPLLVNPLFEPINLTGMAYVKQLVIDSIVVGLIVYVIMPPYTRAIGQWLYKTAKGGGL